MKLRLAISAGVALAALFSAAAFAAGDTKTWTDPNNRVSFDYPKTWDFEVSSSADSPVLVLTIGPADVECRIYIQNSEASTGKPAPLVAKAYAKPIGDDKWKETMSDYNVFHGKGGFLSAPDVDTSGLFPVQSAILTADDGSPAFGMFTERPGWELWEFCRSYDGKDYTATYKAIMASVASPQDAQYKAEMEAAAAKAAADAAKAAAKAADPKKK